MAVFVFFIMHCMCHPISSLVYGYFLIKFWYQTIWGSIDNHTFYIVGFWKSGWDIIRFWVYTRPQRDALRGIYAFQKYLKNRPISVISWLGCIGYSVLIVLGYIACIIWVALKESIRFGFFLNEVQQENYDKPFTSKLIIEGALFNYFTDNFNNK